jgi:hypothetical protein
MKFVGRANCLNFDGGCDVLAYQSALLEKRFFVMEE